MTGFLTGIGMTIILSQLGDLTGYAAKGNNKLAKIGQVDLQTLARSL